MKINLQFILLVLISSFFYSTILSAQNVGIGTSTPAPSAKLDITDTERGILIPRISIPNLNAAAPVATPATSLLVYNTNPTTGEGFYYWDGTQWTKVLDNTDTDQDWYEVGTTNAPDAITDNIFTQGRVGIGTTTPTVPLTVDAGTDAFGIRFLGNSTRHTQVFTNSRTTGTDNNTGIRFQNNDGSTISGVGQIFFTDETFSNSTLDKNSLAIGATRADGTINFFAGTPFSTTIPRMKIAADGNVGIGTANPDQRLELSGGGIQLNGTFGIGFAGDIPNDGNVSADRAKMYYDGNFFGSSLDALIIEKTDINNIDPDGGVAFTMKGSDNIRETTMSIRGNGNVGIGIDNPTSLLHLKRDNPIINIETNTANQQASGQINFKETPGQNNFQIQYDGRTTHEELNFIGLNTVLGTTDTIMSILRTTNNVGIGTTNPVSTFQVNGDARIGLINHPNTGTLPSEGDRLFFSGGNAGATYSSENSDVIFLSRHNSASDQSQLRVSIGDNPQAQDALVIGRTQGTFQEIFRLQTDGNALKPGGGTWATLSDKRTKKEITPFRDGLGVLTQINPVTFKYNGQYQTADDNQTHVGIIAQEVQPVAPYMIGTQNITTEDGTQKELLNYDGGTYMIYVLVNAVKQQQQQLQEAQNKNKLLEQTTQAQATELQNLKAEIEAIKATLNTSTKVTVINRN